MPDRDHRHYVNATAGPTLAQQRSSTMHLSKWGYQADFFVYPVLIATAALRSLW